MSANNRDFLFRSAEVLFLVALFAILFAKTVCLAQEAKPSTFERVFGVPGTFDAAIVEKIKALPAGERLPIDRDGDGKHDELWFIDNSPRHTDARRPILVRVIDEDGDLDVSGPDLDSDLYLADWQADGVVDAAVDYLDEDSDGDVDQMGIFFGEHQKPWLNKESVNVWWSHDIGDDNLLWYDIDWSYEQLSCQHRCHFSGDEVFYRFTLDKDKTHWMNEYVNPFAFFDPDQDECSEVVTRIAATGNEIQSLRYSMDIDNDAHGEHTHDYDFSITALAEKGKLLTDAKIAKSFEIRGIPVVPVLGWQEAREFARQANWAKASLTWDEINSNTDAQVERDPHERWEGVINFGSENFEQVGGPPSSKFNKRVEIALKPALPLRLYYDPTDRRLHLLGASNGWIDIDANLDGKADARYTYIDSNEDGVFDLRQADLDADGTIDFEWKMQGEEVQKLDLKQTTLSEFYQDTLKQSLVDSQAFIDAAKSVLSIDGVTEDTAEIFFTSQLAEWTPQAGLGARIRKTPAGARFYLDLIRDRLFLALQKKFSGHEKWNKVAGAYQAGEYGAAAINLTGLGVESSENPTTTFRSYSKRLAVTIDNTGKPKRENWPVVLPISQLPFEPLGCAVVASERWIDWRQVPHQIDQFDESSEAEISFLVDLPEDQIITYYIYFAPMQEQTSDFASATKATDAWLPQSIGWRSNRAAYRANEGRIDFFGNQDSGGVDALHVESTSGLGGLTLYSNGQSWPVWKLDDESEIEFSNRIISQGPVRSVIEVTAKNVIPNQPESIAKILCLIYAERQETEIRASVEQQPDTEQKEDLTIAPGLVNLVRKQVIDDPERGVYGSWGSQSDEIGEIGLGLIVAPDTVAEVHKESNERRIRCRLSNRCKLKYWVVGDWRRGRRHPVAPTAQNWREKLRKLANRLHDQPKVTLGETESIEN